MHQPPQLLAVLQGQQWLIQFVYLGANFTKAGISVAAIFTFSTLYSNAVPALPGATKTLSANGDCAAFKSRRVHARHFR